MEPFSTLAESRSRSTKPTSTPISSARRASTKCRGVRALQRFFCMTAASMPTDPRKPDYILNQEPYRRAVIAVAGRNFGVGSSRETAVFGLIGFGIRSVIAPNFGDIFFNNSLKNGLLPVRLPATIVDA